MDLFIQFVGAKWYLFTAVIVLLFLLMNHERRKGGPSVDSINLPLAKLPGRIAELERYRDKPVVLVCKFGQSANGAAKSLKENGFTRVFKLGGGISEWQGSQLPLVRS